MKNKKGLSGVVTTLILVLLVLAAVGIIWVVISGIIDEGTQSATISSKCLEVEVKPTKVGCDAGRDNCNVTVTRSAGGEEIAGIKLIFSKEGGESNEVKEFNGNIDALQTITVPTSGPTYSLDSDLDPDKVEVVVFFEDASGNEQLCSGKNSYSF
jgi:flagellin-like protein